MKKSIIIFAFLLLSAASQAQNVTRPDSVHSGASAPASQLADSIANVQKRAKAGDAAAQTILGFWLYSGFDSVKQDYKQAVYWWDLAAKQNNADAIANLGYCYQRGQGVEADSIQAFKLFESAASRGSKNVIPMHDQLARQNKSVFSALLLEDIYKKGIGTKKDVAKAEEYLALAAQYGHGPSLSSYAMRLYNSGKYDLAAPLLHKLADKGDVQATLAYGLLLFEGKGIVQDKAKGIDYLTKAADKGNHSAAYNLGRIYFEGDGVEKDSLKAFKYLKTAAPKDRTNRAPWLLAQCYKDGIGTKQDYRLAALWMAESLDDSKDCRQRVEKFFADDNDGPFTQYLRGIYKFNIDENFVDAQKYFKLVEKAKVAEGTTMTAACLANDKNPKRNVKKAVKLLQGVSADSPYACFCLSQIYAKGDGVQKDTAKAIDLLKKAADADVPEALCVLADRYMTGDGVSKDISQAARLYLKAEAMHHLSPESPRNLAKCYELKVGILPDLNKAEQRIKDLNALKPNLKLNSLLSKVIFK